MISSGIGDNPENRKKNINQKQHKTYYYLPFIIINYLINLPNRGQNGLDWMSVHIKKIKVKVAK